MISVETLPVKGMREDEDGEQRTEEVAIGDEGGLERVKEERFGETGRDGEADGDGEGDGPE